MMANRLFQKAMAAGNVEKFAVITFFQNFYLYNHVGALYMQSRGLSLLQVNSIWSIIVATTFIAEVPTGVIADKIGMKKAVAAALFLQFLGELFFLFAQDYFAFVLIAILAGIGYSFLSGANEALIYHSLPQADRENRMKKAMGTIGGSYQLAFFIAPLLGGLVISELVTSRYLLGIALTAGSVFIAFLISLSLKEPDHGDQHPLVNSLDILKNGISQIARNRKIQWIAAVAVFTSTFSNTLVSLYQPYFVKMGITTSLPIGIALSLGGLAAFLIQRNIFEIERALGRYGLFVLSILPGVFYLLFAFAMNIAAVLPLFVLTYAFADAKNPLISSYQNEQIESQSRATTISLVNMLVKIYVAVMGLVLGWVASSSLPAVWIIIGGLIIIPTLLLRVDQMTVDASR